MARNVALVAFGVVVGVLAGAALHVAAAEEGGAGEAEPVETAQPSASQPDSPTPEPGYGVWDRLAQCESTGNWHIEGRRYSGGLQFDAPTWLGYGGGAYASRASLASRGQQIAVAERVRADRGYQPWPVCSRVVGLR